jgi:hypothetical protein
MTIKYLFFHWLYTPLGPWPLLFSFRIILQTPWTSDQHVANKKKLYRINKKYFTKPQDVVPYTRTTKRVYIRSYSRFEFHV